MPGKDFIGYPKLMDNAMRGLVRDILAQTAKQGLMGSHHFFITFDTRAPGVIVSDDLQARYPVDMTIVLQHKYWGLKVEDTHFEVTLTFNKVPEEIIVPFHAVRRFSDPSQEIGFTLQAVSPEPPALAPAFKPLSAPAKADTPRLETSKLETSKLETPKLEALRTELPKPEAPKPLVNPILDPETPAEPPSQGPTVVSLDSFRKK